MALFVLDHDNDSTIVISQAGQHVVLTIDQVESLIRNLEVARLEMQQARFERHRREEIRKLREWDRERRSFAAVYVPPVDSSQVVD